MKVAVLLLPLLALFAFVARHDGLARTRPAVTSGDEPHYLLAVSSLLYDHDLQLQDDYARVLAGGPQAGLGYRFNELDHHTMVMDRVTREHAMWLELYDWTSHVRCPRPCVPFRRISNRLPPGPTIIEVPAHPVGWPLLLAALVWPRQPSPEELESAAADAMALLAYLALVVLALAAQRAGFTLKESVGAALLCGLASPWLAYSRSYFAEIPIGLMLMLGLLALLAQRPALAGLAIVAAAAIKPPFGLVGVAWAADLWLHGRRREAVRHGAVVAAGGLAIVGFNLWLANMPVISGTTGFIPGSPGFEGVSVLLLSDGHGLLSFAPWAAIALYVCCARLRTDHIRWITLGAGPYLLTLAATNFPQGGYCYGPRYWVPLLPWLALAGLEARGARKALVALALLSALIAIPGALRYRQLFNAPAIAALRR